MNPQVVDEMVTVAEIIPAQTSAKQHAVYTSLQALGYNPVLEKKILDESHRQHVVDIAIEELMTVVEYDGIYWHGSDEKNAKDRAKSLALLDAGWRVVRMRESSPRSYLPPLGIDHWSYGEMVCTADSQGESYDHDIASLVSLIKRITTNKREPRPSVSSGNNGDIRTSFKIETIADMGEALMLARISKGLSQQEVADATGLNRSYISRMESGAIQPKQMQRILKIMKLHGATLKVSFGD